MQILKKEHKELKTFQLKKIIKIKKSLEKLPLKVMQKYKNNSKLVP